MIENSFSHKTSESIDMITDSARDFAVKYIKPYVREWDESQQKKVTNFSSLL